MGVDAASAESALSSPRRSRNLQRSKNQSWRANSAAHRVGSVASLMSPSESTADAGNFRTSERSSASGEFSPICTRWRFCRPDGAETKGGEQVGRRRSVEKVGPAFASLKSTPSSRGNNHRGGHCPDGAFRQHRHCACLRGLTRARGQKATFANQLRGADALAESPWPLSRKQAGAGDKSERCVILAESPWVILPGCSPGRRGGNRS